MQLLEEQTEEWWGVGERGGKEGGAARFNDLGLARAAAKVSVQLYTVIIHAPTSLPTHTLIIFHKGVRNHSQEDPLQYKYNTSRRSSDSSNTRPIAWSLE